MTDRTLPEPVAVFIARICNLFPEVAWDRIVPLPADQQAVIYGWLPARDSDRVGKATRDFVMLDFVWSDGYQRAGLATSSAKHSADFMARLDRAQGWEPRDHDAQSCIPVEDVLGGRVKSITDRTRGVDINIEQRRDCPRCGWEL